jgi:UDP-N-acetylmuramoyl-L-alanyl-D-glutamate--2,6-diaminopimelate ligase
VITCPAPISLLDLLRDAGLQEVEICGNPHVLVHGLSVHAQSVQRGFAFVAQKGANADSHHFAGEAMARGASVIFADSPLPPLIDVTVVRVENTRAIIGSIAQAAAGNPAQKMKTVGVTGTNGKTTTTFILEQIFTNAGIPIGRIGTLGSTWGKGKELATNTTPGPVELASVMAKMYADGVRHVAMEVSSHGIHQDRIAGVPFVGGALTNITQDHLDYHGTYEAYVTCKKGFFLNTLANTPGALSILNIDDPVGEELMREIKNGGVAYCRGTERDAHIQAEEIVCGPNFTEFILRIGTEFGRVRSTLVGGFNITNMLSAAGLAWAMGLDVKTIADGLSSQISVPGRFEKIDCGQPFTVLVDYAHTPDALSRVIRAARRLSHNRLVTVFGCGGNRDQGKRPLMGRVAGLLSDHVFVTNDNPRDEDPEEIARHIVEGLLAARMKPARYQTILDRRNAIESAIGFASPGDVVLIAGKGHETYQESCGVRSAFDDREIAATILGNMKASFLTQNAESETSAIHRGEGI